MTVDEAKTLAVTPREYRLVVERLLQHGRLDRGIVIPLRDIVLDAELATGAALRYIVEHPTAPTLQLAPAVLDEVRRLGTVTLYGLDAPALLTGLTISGLRYGIRVALTGTDPITVTVAGDSPRPASNAERYAGGPQRLAAMTHGIAVDEQLWWTAYRRSNLALSVDTRVSRRHAGATIVEPDGTIRGATDDEIDPTVFTGDREALFDESKER